MPEGHDAPPDMFSSEYVNSMPQLQHNGTSIAYGE